MSIQKSTIVRVRNTARRTFFATADRVAPRLAGRIARDLWFGLPPAMRPTPLPEGGESCAVTSLGARVRGQVWGPADGHAPVVYLVHGWGGLGSQLTAYVEPLVDAGHRVVLFDAPAHGDSEPGPSGAGRTHGVELGRALDAVAARFGPAHAVVAHSLGATATYLTLRYGWLGTDRLVLIAPMVEAATLFDAFQRALGFGERTRRAFDREVDEFVGVPVEEFDIRVQAAYVDPIPTLIVHDRQDRQTAYSLSAELADTLPDARLVTTDGLGHRRILRDPRVVAEVVEFLTVGDRQAVA